MSIARKVATVLRSAKESGHFCKRLAAEVLLQTGTTTLCTIRRPGYVLTYYPSALSTTLFLNRNACLNDELLLRHYLRPGDVVVDVGSNIGTHTLAAATLVGDDGLVVAIEPHPKTFSYLEGNVRRNARGNVVLLNVANGETDGEVGFTDRYEDNENCIATSPQPQVVVPLRRLDSIAPTPHRAIALLKIDVEGFELPVLRGAAETLARTEAILYEACEDHCVRFGYHLADLIGWLAARGLPSYRVDVPARRITPLQPQETVVGCENLLALRNPEAFLARTGFTAEAAQSGR